jgi:hypothetical protein
MRNRLAMQLLKRVVCASRATIIEMVLRGSIQSKETIMVDFRSVTWLKQRLRTAAAWLGVMVSMASWLGTGRLQGQTTVQPVPFPPSYSSPPLPTPPPPPTLPVRVTFTGPAQSPPDQPVTFKAQIQNTGTTAMGKLVLRVNVAGTEELITVESLAVNESRIVSLAFTPRRTGVFILGQRTEAQERDNPGIFKKLETAKLRDTTIFEEIQIQQGTKSTTTGVVKAMKVIDPESVTAHKVLVKFDAATPVKDLLPPAPKASAVGKIRLPQTLAQIPELSLQDPLAKSLKLEQTVEHTARTIDRIHHLNQKKTDAFMEALLANRLDLAGLPFAMGDSCRLNEERSRQFAYAVTSMRNARGPLVRPAPLQAPPTLSSVSASAPSGSIAISSSTSFSAAQDPLFEPNPGDALMEAFAKLCDDADKNDKRAGAGHAKQTIPARVALAMQVISPEAPALRLGLVKYLSRLPHVDATRALAQLAIYSEEDEVRRAAIEALKTRREKDYTGVMLEGLNYPWPAVAKRAAAAIVQLERSDLLGNLIEVLERPDPRAPRTREVKGKKVAEVRELVRINHHRNCLLCHAPLDPESNVSSERSESLRTLVVQVPQPAEELPAPFAPSAVYYESSNPDILVRVDVTYLRQDFSMKLPVADSQAWPEMQRFDFVVRTREVTEQEAKAYQDLLQPSQLGVLSPYHRAALFALRELTGRDTEPTAPAWRKLLNL